MTFSTWVTIAVLLTWSVAGIEVPNWATAAVAAITDRAPGVFSTSPGTSLPGPAPHAPGSDPDARPADHSPRAAGLAREVVT